jgi:hypothetical protein
MLMMSPDRVERMVQRAHWYVLGGVAAFGLAVALPQDLKCGVISGWLLCSLGFYAGVLRRWRVEPGLWMLSVFLGIVAAAIYAYMVFSRLERLFVPRQPNPLQPGLAVDIAIATTIVWTQVRFFGTITRLNWQVAGHASLDEVHRRYHVAAATASEAGWWAVVPRVVASMMIFATAFGVAGVLAVSFAFSFLGMNINDGVLLGAASGVYVGITVGVRAGMFGLQHANAAFGEMRIRRVATVLGAVLVALLFLAVAVVRGNIPWAAIGLLLLFGAFCGSVIGLIVGVIGADFWTGWGTVLPSLLKGNTDDRPNGGRCED